MMTDQKYIYYTKYTKIIARTFVGKISFVEEY